MGNIDQMAELLDWRALVAVQPPLVHKCSADDYIVDRLAWRDDAPQEKLISWGVYTRVH